MGGLGRPTLDVVMVWAWQPGHESGPLETVEQRSLMEAHGMVEPPS